MLGSQWEIRRKGKDKCTDLGSAPWFSASLETQTVKNLPAMQETWIGFLGREDPLEKGIGNRLQYSSLGFQYLG